MPHRPVLAHRLDGPDELYRLTSITVPAVTIGTVTAEVRCGACRQHVRCTIESPPARRRRLRHRRMAVYGALALAVPAAIVIVLLVEPANLRGALGVGFVVAVVAGSVALGAFESLDHEVREGIRLPGKRPPHSLRHARDLTPDGRGNWRRGGASGSGSGFRDGNAEPLIDGPL